MRDMWREVLAAHELFRRLGFRPDAIDIAVSEEAYGVKLTGAGGRVETVKLGPLPERPGPWLDSEWREASRSWNAGEVEGDKVYGDSIARRTGLNLLWKMERDGFRPEGGWAVPVRTLAEVASLMSEPN